MVHVQAGILQRVGAPMSPDVSDQQLLARFLATRDEAAFAGLVQRHGRSVWGVCRRLLPQQQDAEDAFQAVFLALARKAAAIRKGEALGSWLYGVAYRTALKVRNSAVRRSTHERQAAEVTPPPAPWSEAACRELQRLLDEEVQRLTEKYRAPFVLCCLEGLSRAEAARELGWKEGTVAGRLARARQLLQTRLARRGITLSAVLTAAALAQDTAAAAAPAVLVQATVQAVAAPAAGTAALSPSAVTLADGLVRTMAVAKLKAGAMLVALTTMVAGAGLTAYQMAPPAAAEKARPEEPVVVLEPERFLPQPIPVVMPIDEQVLAVAFSPDGKRLVTAGGRHLRPGQLKIWDVETRKNLVTLKGFRGIRTVAFSPDGKILATGHFGGDISLRDPDSGEERAVLKGHTVGVNSLAFSPDGTTLVSAGLDQVVKLWDVKGLKEQKLFLGHTGMVYAAAFFHDGRAFVTGGQDRTAVIWDVATGKVRFPLRGHGAPVEAVAVSPDDKIVATGSWDQTIKLWDAQAGKETGVLTANHGMVLAVAFSPTGDLLASAAGDGTVCLWDVKTRKEVGKLQGHGAPAWSLAFSRDGKLLASGSSDRTAKLWDVTAAKEVATLVAGAPEDRPVLALAYAPDGKALATATGDNTVQIRDARSGEVQRVLTGHAEPVSCLAFAPDGQTLASGSADQTVKLWDPATGQEKHTLKGHTEGVTALAFAPDGKKLASAGGDMVVKLWDPVEGKEVGALKGHQAPLAALAFARDGRRLASAGADGLIKVWDLSAAGEPTTLLGHECPVRALAFAADGTLASGGQDATVRLWDVADGKERRTLSRHKAEVAALAFSPGGKTLVSGDRTGMVVVWDPGTGKVRQAFGGRHHDLITALAFHPHGADLVSGSRDTTVLRWLPAPTGPPARTLAGNPRGVWFAAYSPAGGRLASGGMDGTVTLWARGLAPALYPSASLPGVYWDVAFSPDGRTMALANDTNVQLCDADSGEVRRTLPMGQALRSVAFSPDGRYVAASTGNWSKADAPSETGLFDVATGTELARLQGHTGMTFRAQFSPDGKTLATTAKDNTIRLWEVPSGQLRTILRGHGAPARGMAFLPDGTLVTASWDGTIRFWDVVAGRQTKGWKVGMGVASLGVSPDGTLLAAAEGATKGKGTARLKVWEVATGQEKFNLKGHQCRILGLTFTRDGRGLLAAGGKLDFGEINLWDLATGALRYTHKTTRKWMENIAISMDDRRVVSATVGGLRLWDLDFLHPERTWTAHGNFVSCGLFADGGKTLITGSWDWSIKVWDIASGDLRATLKGHRAGVRALALLSDGKTLVSSSEDTTIKLWDLATFKEKGILAGHTRAVYCLAVSPDGKTLAAGGGDYKKPEPAELILWDLETGQPRRKFDGLMKGVWSVAYSPDGKSLAAATSNGILNIWDTATGELRATLFVDSVRPLAFSPDGKLLAVGRGKAFSKASTEPGEGSVVLVDTATWKERAKLPGHKHLIFWLAFSPDGRSLASASQDGTIKLWTVQGGEGTVRPAPPEIVLGTGAKAGLVVRATDPVIVAEPLPNAEAEPSSAGGKVWLALLIVSLLAIALTLALWRHLRKGHHAGRVSAQVPAPNPTDRPAQAVVCACDGCGKEIRARAALAGKRVRCPKCGQAVRLPATHALAAPPSAAEQTDPDR